MFYIENEIIWWLGFFLRVKESFQVVGMINMALGVLNNKEGYTLVG